MKTLDDAALIAYGPSAPDLSFDNISFLDYIPVHPAPSRGALPGRWSSRGGVWRLRVWGGRRPGPPGG